MSSGCHSVKELSTTVVNSIVAMVTGLCGVISLIIQEAHGILCMPCFPRIISELLPEIRTLEKCDFLFKSFLNNLILLYTVSLHALEMLGASSVLVLCMCIC